MRRLFRRLIPFRIRKKIHVWKHRVEDCVQGIQFASLDTEEVDFEVLLIHEQAIMPSKNYSQKVHNFQLAIDQIETVVIKPNQVFSFNHIVGEGCAERGYQKSRSLNKGVLIQTYGGGLCQLAGLIYQASLQIGLNVIERHNHSVDIYTDDTRYTPLGSDATISYAFKDLRIQNNHSCSFRFRFQITDHKISLSIESTDPVPVHNVVYQIVQTEPQKVVHTKNHHHETVAISVYDQLS